jgi:hypothetical protein
MRTAAETDSPVFYDWLEGRGFLVIRADRKPLLVVVTLELAAEIIAMAERAKRITP